MFIEVFIGKKYNNSGIRNVCVSKVLYCDHDCCVTWKGNAVLKRKKATDEVTKKYYNKTN